MGGMMTTVFTYVMTSLLVGLVGAALLIIYYMWTYHIKPEINCKKGLHVDPYVHYTYTLEGCVKGFRCRYCKHKWEEKPNGS